MINIFFSLDISGMFQGKTQTNTTDLLTAKRDFLVCEFIINF